MIDENDRLGLSRDKRLVPDLRIITGHVERVLHVQVILAGEIKIALIMCRTAKYSACTVIHHDKITDPDGQLLIRIDRVLNAYASIHALLRGFFHSGFGRVHLAAFRDELGQIRAISLKRFRDRVIRCHSDKRRTAHCVRAG